LLYKLRFAQSNADVAHKALGVAHTTLKAKIAMGGSTFNPGEKDGYEAAMTTAETTLVENDRAHQAVMAAIDDSDADTLNARSHKDVRLAEMDAVFAEGDDLIKRLHLTLTQNGQRDVMAETGVMATATCERITMEEANIMGSALKKRVEAARLRHTDAFAELDANNDFTQMLLRGCCR